MGFFKGIFFVSFFLKRRGRRGGGEIEPGGICHAVPAVVSWQQEPGHRSPRLSTMQVRSPGAARGPLPYTPTCTRRFRPAEPPDTLAARPALLPSQPAARASPRRPPGGALGTRGWAKGPGTPLGNGRGSRGRDLDLSLYDQWARQAPRAGLGEKSGFWKWGRLARPGGAGGGAEGQAGSR